MANSRRCWRVGGRVSPESRWGAPAALAFAKVAGRLGHLSDAEKVLKAAVRHPSSQVPALSHALVNMLGQQGRVSEARRLIESLWSETAIVADGDLAGRLSMLRDHMALDIEPFPTEWNLSRLEAGSASSDDDRRALALAAPTCTRSSPILGGAGRYRRLHRTPKR